MDNLKPSFKNQFTSYELGGDAIVYSEVIELNMYRNSRGQLAFDDDRVGIKNEPFVAGMDKVLEALALQAGSDTFTLKMRGFAIPNCDITWTEKPTNEYFEVTLNERLYHNIVGRSHWYDCKKLEQRVWLCPNLHRYYNIAPDIIWFYI